MAKTYQNSKGQTFSTHAAAAASNTSLGTNPSAKKSSSSSSVPAYNAATGATTGKASPEYETYLKSLNKPGSANYVPTPDDPGMANMDAANNAAIAANPQINTSQPSPTTAQITPPSATVTPPNPTVASAGQSDVAGLGQPNDLASRYKAGFAATQGTQAPQSSAQGSAAVQANLPKPQQEYQPMPEVQTELDKTISAYTQAVAQFVNPKNQRDTLVKEYDSLSKSLGIQGLNSELMDINRIMDGTEDDIRSEVTAASGFATESQVQALTIGRNKSLLKKAQFIQDQLTSAKDELNMKINLSKEDKQFAQTQMMQGLSAMGNLVQIQQSMHKAAQDNYNNVVQRQGYDGLLAMTGGNPYNIGLAEQTMGLEPGGLQKLATLDATKRAKEQAKADLQNQVLESNLATDALQRKKLQADIDGTSMGGVDEKTIGKIQSSNEYKTITGVMPAIQTIKDYMASVNKSGTQEYFNGAEAGNKKATYGNAIAAWKTLAGLGALSGADFGLAENVIPAPSFFTRSSKMTAQLSSALDNAVKQTENLTSRLSQNYPKASNLLNAQLDDIKVIAYPDKFTKAPDGSVIEIIK